MGPDTCGVPSPWPQVVLPLLQNEVVVTGWVSEADFLTGLALVQAMPGPLFNFAAYLGARLPAPCAYHALRISCPRLQVMCRLTHRVLVAPCREAGVDICRKWQCLCLGQAGHDGT
jgi:hypothetical protein